MSRNDSSPIRRAQVAIMLFAGLVLGAAASAQESDGFSEATLRSYASAAVEVRQIQVAAGKRVGEADDPNRQAEIRERAQQDMVQAVREQGLTVEEYNEIFKATQSDGRMREQVMEYMSEAAES